MDVFMKTGSSLSLGMSCRQILQNLSNLIQTVALVDHRSHRPASSIFATVHRSCWLGVAIMTAIFCDDLSNVTMTLAIQRSGPNQSPATCPAEPT
jgi:hypothetical protein